MRSRRPGRRLSPAFVLLFTALTSGAFATTFTVTNTDDSGAGSLRQAILDANANPGADVIAFSIVGSGVHTITPADELPTIADAVTIDGYTQPGASPNTQSPDQGTNAVLRIEIDGTTSGGSFFNAALITQGPSNSNVTIRGLVINRCTRERDHDPRPGKQLRGRRLFHRDGPDRADLDRPGQLPRHPDRLERHERSDRRVDAGGA